MIFEFPFDLIVIARIHPPYLAGNRVLFFTPLFVIEIMTLSLLILSPMVRLTRATFFAFAAMLAVFAVWALAGFGSRPRSCTTRATWCRRSLPS